MKIQIIIGSTRPGRVGPQVADWILKNVLATSQGEFEIVDIADWKLPLFDEPVHPSKGQYGQAHTKAWSEKIKEADGYVFVTPEYNAGYPAAFKNAIDYLYHEWTAKPVVIVSYGIQGGVTASAQLRQVAERLKMRVIETSPALTVTDSMRDEDGRVKDIDELLKDDLPSLKLATEELVEAVAAGVA